MNPIIKSLFNIHPSWDHVFDIFLEAIEDKAAQLVNSNFFPPAEDVWNAFKIPYSNIKCIILAQDPYHSVGINGKPIAHGYAFSCRPPNKPQPSLKNIYKELKASNFRVNKESGDISSWSSKGVLLLNTYLTVEPCNAGSHKFWGAIIYNIIKCISNDHNNLVFMLWGAKAKAVKEYINTNRHLVLEADHPSLINRNSNFIGCNHFLLCNKYLNDHNIEIIDWNLC